MELQIKQVGEWEDGQTLIVQSNLNETINFGNGHYEAPVRNIAPTQLSPPKAICLFNVNGIGFDQYSSARKLGILRK